MLVLICNVGSTSLKYKLFRMPSPDILVEAKVERVGSENAIFSYCNHLNGFEAKMPSVPIAGYVEGIQLFLRYLTDAENGAIRCVEELDAVGFKTVLSKGFYGVHELTPEVLQGMEDFIGVAPSHNPPYIAAIRVFRELLPDTLMVGSFETAFNRTIPEKRRLYGIPYEWYEKYNIQRFGYHGASHGYITRQVREMAGEHFRLIDCHLGGSGSVCAIRDGKAEANSWGFSLQSGLIHSNRPGDVDLFIVPYLLEQGLSMEEILKGLSSSSGLKGISGISGDLRDVEVAAEAGNERAALAIDIFCESVVHYIGAYYAILGGLDYLVFTGGIGENSAIVREKVCAGLSHMGIVLDRDANLAPRNDSREISVPGAGVHVMVIPTNEEVGIAQNIYEQFGNA